MKEKLAELEKKVRFRVEEGDDLAGESTGSRSRERHFEKKAPKGSHWRG